MAINSNKDGALLGDVPVGEAGREDHLSFSATAEVVARATISTQDPLTIGIFGEWGTGKTSLMRLIWEKVKKVKGTAPVWFNAWQYEKEEHLIVPLVATINKELAKKRTKVAKEIGKALQSIASGFSLKGKIGVPLITEAELHLSPKDTFERYQNLTKDTLLSRSLYFDAFGELSEHTKKKGAPRIVVFVDDLDRCFPDKAVELLEGIKLVLHQPGFSFVLGVNDAIIRQFVTTKYKKDYDIDFGSTYNEDYLEKIVQLEIRVPKRESGQMQEYIRDLLGKGRVLSEFKAEGITDQELYVQIAEAGRRNPREIVRLLNGLLVTWRIEKKKYNLSALLVDRVASNPKYQEFRDDLEFQRKDDGQPLGGCLADALASEAVRTAGNHSLRINVLREAVKELKYTTLEKAIKTLEENEHLCNVLRSDTGRHWLSSKEYRKALGMAFESAVGKKEPEEKKEEAPPIERGPVAADLEIRMVPIPAGNFQMGSEDQERETPVHRVNVDAFEMSATPVTQAQYEAIMGKNPSFSEKHPDHPVEGVSWHDAKEFCEKLSARTGQHYSLPTEAQWEYACRAGSDTRYCFGDDPAQLGDYGWYDENSVLTPQPVGRKKKNDYGLYDMHGNVWEWCEDAWHDDYNGAPTDGSAWESPSSPYRVWRGGSFSLNDFYCCSAYRSRSSPDGRHNSIGFRVARTP